MTAQARGMDLLSMSLPWRRSKELQPSQGRSCSRCRRHKIRCDKQRPCQHCRRIGLEDCDALFGVSTCEPCRQSKLKCDKLRPCGTCLRRAKAEECREPFTRSNPSSSSPELSYPATPESPWPLQLAVQLQSDRAAGLTDPTLGNLQLLAVRMSQAGYSGTSILYMFNSMGRELFDVLNDVMGFLLKLQPRQASPSPHPRNTSFEHDRSGQASAILMEGRQAAGSWTVFWEEDYLMRRGIEVGQGLGRLLHRNPEEILSRAARCEFEIPSSDLEFICMIVDDLLRLSSPRIVRYQRICRRSVDGRLEESSLVRVTSVKHFEEERLKSTCHTMEILDADEWSRIHEDKSNWTTYIQLRSLLGEELGAEDLLLAHKKDMVRAMVEDEGLTLLQLFSEHFATLNETEEGRHRLKRVADFIRSKFRIPSSPPGSDRFETVT